jgi:hypothetical protein
LLSLRAASNSFEFLFFLLFIESSKLLSALLLFVHLQHPSLEQVSLATESLINGENIFEGTLEIIVFT